MPSQKHQFGNPYKFQDIFGTKVLTLEKYSRSKIFWRSKKSKYICPFLHKNFHPVDLLLLYSFAFNRNQISKLLCNHVIGSPTHPLKSYHALPYQSYQKSHRPESLFLVRLEKFLKRKRLKQNRREYSIGFRIWSPSLINAIDTFYNQQHP